LLFRSFAALFVQRETKKERQVGSYDGCIEELLRSSFEQSSVQISREVAVIQARILKVEEKTVSAATELDCR